MMIDRKKTNYSFMFSGFLFIMITIGFYKFALHSNMEYWKKNRLVIDRVQISEKVVALTFDDGPDPLTTPAVLAILQKHQVPATFFVLGQKAEKNPVLLQLIANSGHEIGNHSYSHQNFNRASSAKIREEIRQTNAILEKLTGQQPVLFRPPGGYLSNEMIRITQEENVVVAYWSWETDSKDWRNNSSRSIADHITKHIAPGQIIILHDGGKNGLITARAVDLLITQLKEKDYSFATMGELLKLENQE